MPTKPASAAASQLAALSVAARKAKWGEAEFVKRMQQWGRLGGRPKGSTKQAKGGN